MVKRKYISKRKINGVVVNYCGRQLTRMSHTGPRSWYLWDFEGFLPIGSDKWIIDYVTDYCGATNKYGGWVILCQDCYQNAGFEW